MHFQRYCTIKDHHNSLIILICLNKKCSLENRLICNKCLNESRHFVCQQLKLVFDENILKGKYNRECERTQKEQKMIFDKMDLLRYELDQLQKSVVDSLGKIFKRMDEIFDNYYKQKEVQRISFQGFQISEQMINKLINTDTTQLDKLQSIHEDFNRIKLKLIDKITKIENSDIFKYTDDSQRDKKIIPLPFKQKLKQHKLPKLKDVEKIIIRETLLIAQSENQIDIYQNDTPTISLYFKHSPSKMQLEFSDIMGKRLVVSNHNKIHIISFPYGLDHFTYQVEYSTQSIKQILFMNSSKILTLQENNCIIVYRLDEFSQLFKFQFQPENTITSIDYCVNLDLIMVRNNNIIQFYNNFFLNKSLFTSLDEENYQLAKFVWVNQFITQLGQNIQIWSFQFENQKLLKKEIKIHLNILDIYPIEDDALLLTTDYDFVYLNNLNRIIKSNCQNQQSTKHIINFQQFLPIQPMLHKTQFYLHILIKTNQFISIQRLKQQSSYESYI